MTDNPLQNDGQQVARGTSAGGIGSLVRRRRAVTVAVGLAVGTGLSGCGMLPGQSGGTGAQQTMETGAVTPAMVDSRVREFTSGIDSALDQVDRDRLRAAAEKRAALAAAAAKAAEKQDVVEKGEKANGAANAAGSAGAAAAGSQVILATSTGGANKEKTEAAVMPVAAPATPAAPAAAPTVAADTAAAGAGADGKAMVAVGPPAPAGLSVSLASPGAGPGAGNATPAAAPAIVVKPAAKAVTAGEAVPVGNQTPGDAVITPIATPQSSTPSAMGSMTAMATPVSSDAAPAAGGSGNAAAVVTTPSPAVSVAAPAEPTLEDAMAVLRKRVAQRPTLATALALSLLDDQGKASDAVKNLSDTDQKVFADLLGALQGMSATSPAEALTVADRTAPIVDVAKKWEADADLQLPKLVLATRVDSFGVYNAVEPKFEQGRKHTVIIYCEVANFGSTKGEDGWYTTKLSQQETLITEDGLLVWRPNAEEVEDKSMNQRHDFYLVKKLTIPENLAVGKYTLRMSVKDRNRDRMSMVSMPIEIVGR